MIDLEKFQKPSIKKVTVKKHLCFTNSFHALAANPWWTLVHGVCIGTGPQNGGKEFGHAWLEFDNGALEWVYDPTADWMGPKVVYYASGKVGFTRRYSTEEASAQARKTLNTGPWHKTILASGHRAPRKKR